MSFRIRKKSFQNYILALHRCLAQMICPDCDESMLPKYFEKHCVRHHNINGKTCCVWCKRLSWPSGAKAKHGDHLLICFRQFMKSFGPPSQWKYNADPSEDFSFDQSMNDNEQSSDYNSSGHFSNPDPTTTTDFASRPYCYSQSNGESSTGLLDMTHEFPEKDFFGHQLAYSENLEEDIWPVENLPSLPISFADENLNLAAACVLLYLTKSFDFFHASVKCQTMKSFLQAMNEDRGTSRTLPFSCWCNGGDCEEAKYRQHRHFIIVSPKNHFKKNVWEKIKLPSDRLPNSPCRRLKLIVSPLHLVNTIGYLSQRESQCELSFSGNRNVRTRDNHFYLYKTLPKHFKLHLALLWKDGLVEYLKRIKFQNVSVARLAEGVLTRKRNGQWIQKIKDFYGHERGMVIHVDKDYIPTNKVTPHFLHLMNGKVLYFDKSLENRNLDQETWLRKQIEGGNCFYDAVEENVWIPRPRDQAVLNFYKPLVDRCRELEESNREKDEAMRSLQLKLEETRLEMQRCMDQIIQCKDGEIVRLRKENYKQRQKINRLLSRRT